MARSISPTMHARAKFVGAGMRGRKFSSRSAWGAASRALHAEFSRSHGRASSTSTSHAASNPGMGGLVKWGLIGGAVYIGFKALAAASAPKALPPALTPGIYLQNGTGL